MKKTAIIAVALLIIIAGAGAALAVDIAALDRVSVLMEKAQVVSLLGNPDEVTGAEHGLQAEIYGVEGMAPLVGTGCIYQDGRLLVGQSFLFQGELDKVVADRLMHLGFTMQEDPAGGFRLLGKDDDTGSPLVAHVTRRNGMTIVTTFEKGFYDRMVR